MKFFGFPIFLVALARAQNDADVHVAVRYADYNDANGLSVDDWMRDYFEEDAEAGW